MADKQQQKKKQDVNPYSGKFVPKKKDPLRPFLPVIGLAIIAVAGAVAWFGAPFLLQWLFTQNFFSLPDAMRSTEPVTLYADFVVPANVLLQAITALLIFFVIVGIAAVLYAVVAPRPPKLVSENILAAERKQIQLDQQREEARKRKMRSRMKNATKGIDDI